MGVLFFYLVALIPVIVGAIIWYNDEEVVWQEWLGSVAAAFVYAGLIHWGCLFGMTSDVETLSGQITHATHFPEWVEEYTVIDYCTRTDDKGHTETYPCGSHEEYRTHPEHWTADVDFGITSDDYEIEESFWREIAVKFKNVTTERPYKSGFYSGDRNVYVSYNRTGYIFPATTRHRFENRVKAAPSLFSFAKVPPGTKIYPWPRNEDTFNSDRLLGTASVLFDRLAFDQMNSRLGPVKRVNVIMVGFINEDSEFGQLQEAAWIGGKKNDLVLAFGGLSRDHPARWAHVFGWTESDLCKRNLETLLVEQAASPKMLELIEKEVTANYRIKDWTKFDYITVEPPAWSYWVSFLGMLVTQTGLYVWFHNNDLGAVKRWGGYALKLPRRVSGFRFYRS